MLSVLIVICVVLMNIIGVIMISVLVGTNRIIRRAPLNGRHCVLSCLQISKTANNVRSLLVRFRISWRARI